MAYKRVTEAQTAAMLDDVRRGMSYAQAAQRQGLEQTAAWKAVQKAGGRVAVLSAGRAATPTPEPRQRTEPAEALPPAVESLFEAVGRVPSWRQEPFPGPMLGPDLPPGPVPIPKEPPRNPPKVILSRPGPVEQCGPPTITPAGAPEPRLADAFDRMQAMPTKPAGGTGKADRIEFPGDKPVALAFLADLHFGGPCVDYQAARRDAVTVRDTPGMYAAILGDMTDNWILPAMQHLQQGALLSQSDAVRMLRAYLGVLGSKLVAAVAGNHDLWSDRQAGVDILRLVMPETCRLYARHELLLDVAFRGGASCRMLLRHKWPHSSQYNPTHGIEWAARFGDTGFDLGIGGHTHPGTFCRPFPWRQKMLHAVMVGTYKFRDDYRDAGQFPRQPDSHRGAGALVLYPDGRRAWFDDLQTAADFLQFLRR